MALSLTGNDRKSSVWDATATGIKITYPSSGNNSAFTYDPFGRMVKIVETVASSVTSTKQHIWCDMERCEERDGSGTPSRQFYTHGQVNSSTNYFYSGDHLGSVNTMTNDNGDVQAASAFSPFGRSRKLEGAQDSDFQFAGYYLHSRSGLSLTVHRAYSALLGRFINRDPIGEAGGINLFEYVGNEPINSIDGSGLFQTSPPNCGSCPPPKTDLLARRCACTNECTKRGLTGVLRMMCVHNCMWELFRHFGPPRDEGPRKEFVPPSPPPPPEIKQTATPPEIQEIPTSPPQEGPPPVESKPHQTPEGPQPTRPPATPPQFVPPVLK